MRLPWTLGALIIAVLALSACSTSSTASSESAASTSSTTSTTSAPPTPSSPTPGAETACGLFGNGDDSLMARIPTAITALGSQATQAEVDDMLNVHAELETAANHAPTDLATALRKLDEPFADFADQVATGGGAISIDTSTVMTDTTEVMRLCVDAGFQISDTVPEVG